jgi:hypothetical protein
MVGKGRRRIQPFKCFIAAAIALKGNREELVAAGAIAEGIAGLFIGIMLLVGISMLVYPFNFIAFVLLFRTGNAGQYSNVNG